MFVEEREQFEIVFNLLRNICFCKFIFGWLRLQDCYKFQRKLQSKIVLYRINNWFQVWVYEIKVCKGFIFIENRCLEKFSFFVVQSWICIGFGKIIKMRYFGIYELIEIFLVFFYILY